MGERCGEKLGVRGEDQPDETGEASLGERGRENLEERGGEKLGLKVF